MRHSVQALLVSLLLGTALAACGSGGGSTPVASLSAPAAASSVSPAAVGSDATTERVNANTASVEELQAAFEAAGISNADRWAREVAEYRPYPDDPDWSKLRGELSKYNIGSDVLERIITVLET